MSKNRLALCSALNAALLATAVGLISQAARANDGNLAPVKPICMTVDYKISDVTTQWVGNGTEITATISRGTKFPGNLGSVDVELYEYGQYRGSLPTGQFPKVGVKKVVFFVPHNIYQPDAFLRVIVDPRDRVQECNEKNNTFDFISIG